MKLLSIIMSLFVIAQPVNAALSKTAIIITVVNLYTNKPIKDATVCLIDGQKYYKTDKNGKCEIVFEDSKNVENCSVLVYLDGFSDHLAFNLKITKGVVRFAPTIYLKELSDDSPPYTTSSDIPNDKEIQKIIEKYKK